MFSSRPSTCDLFLLALFFFSFELASPVCFSSSVRTALKLFHAACGTKDLSWLQIILESTYSDQFSSTDWAVFNEYIGRKVQTI